MSIRFSLKIELLMLVLLIAYTCLGQEKKAEFFQEPYCELHYLLTEYKKLLNNFSRDELKKLQHYTHEQIDITTATINSKKREIILIQSMTLFSILFTIYTHVKKNRVHKIAFFMSLAGVLTQWTIKKVIKFYENRLNKYLQALSSIAHEIASRQL